MAGAPVALLGAQITRTESSASFTRPCVSAERSNGCACRQASSMHDGMCLLTTSCTILHRTNPRSKLVANSIGRDMGGQRGSSRSGLQSQRLCKACAAGDPNVLWRHGSLFYQAVVKQAFKDRLQVKGSVSSLPWWFCSTGTVLPLKKLYIAFGNRYP